TGSGGLTRSGAGALIIGGSTSNDYTGLTTLLGAGTVYLNKTGGATAIGGNVVIGDSGSTPTVQYGMANNSTGQSNQIAANAVVSFNSSSILSLNGSSQTLGGIQTITGSPIIQNGTAT